MGRPPSSRHPFLMSFAAARRALAAIGIVFLVSGVTVAALWWARVIPAAFHWHGPAFLFLGAVGTTTALLWLRPHRRWVLAVLGAVYGPWTVLGLLGDLRQGLWALVAGEGFGLMLLAWALVSAAAGGADGETPVRPPARPRS